MEANRFIDNVWSNSFSKLAGVWFRIKCLGNLNHNANIIILWGSGLSAIRTIEIKMRNDINRTF